ncbi:hypothetical protein [Chengkuizengella sediminis]|uniref:hypothetical protein n=1 Tax=Chengkuizengella sediminis TaxID=1885917 RepID=UPI0013896147|nr:hypothetical protein [Chengkuizengella sediminis]NDI33598.1 hypothetical protein [Chengkuizengella sediminis]
MNTFLERIKQPHILFMVAALIYQGLEYFGYGIEQETFEMTVDVCDNISIVWCDSL